MPLGYTAANPRRFARYTPESREDMNFEEGADYRQEIFNHFYDFVGSPTLLRQGEGENAGIDLYIVNPSKGKDYYTVFTVGMSGFSMNVPADILSRYEFLDRAELMLCLPKKWKLESENINDSWPLDWLFRLARFPHEYNTWLGFGHSLPSGEDYRPFSPKTKMMGFVLSVPVTVPEVQAFSKLRVHDGNFVVIYSVIPVYPREYSYKLKKNAQVFLDKFLKKGYTELLDPGRKSVCR